MATQWASGNQNVQIHDVTGSSIHIVYGGQRREVPLEPAVVGVGRRVRSPARLIRARSGVVPYAARAGLLGDLEQWARGDDAFAGCVVGGRGGVGKTRLGVELCVRAQNAGWLCGLLSRRADQAALEALVQAPTPRLVVIDYAESRTEQLEVLLPLLAAQASADHPVRVLLLVRAAPRRSEDWTEALRHHGDALDSVLDDVDVRVLEHDPLELADRQGLFEAATGAFAARAEPAISPVPPAPAVLARPLFTNPLLVVIAAYVAVHADRAVPTTRAELLEELAAHEDRYWQATAGGLDTDQAIRQRVVALATLAGATSEAEAVGLLRLVPDLADASAERRGRLARWAHQLYPGPQWWNPLEPDLVGEHLVATCFSEHPQLLTGVLDRPDPAALFQPLDVYARAAPDHPPLAAALRSVLTDELESLCGRAINQAATETDVDLLLGGTTVATALDRTVTVIDVDPEILPHVLDRFPSRPDLILSPLALTLTAKLVAHLRRLAAADPAAYEPDLAASLNDLSANLADVGRRAESLAAVEEAVNVYRRLAAADPAGYEPGLARSLSNLSVSLAEAGRGAEGLAAIEAAVKMYRALAAAYEPELANALNTLSVHLGEAGRTAEGLAAIEAAVKMYRALAAADPAAYEPEVASALGNLSNRLGEAGREAEGLAAIEEAVKMYRRLAAANPAAYEPALAMVLSNLSVDLGEADRGAEGLAAIEEAVKMYRRLAAANPAAHEPGLASALKNLSLSLGEAGRTAEGLAAIEEAVKMYRALAAADPAAYEPELASALGNLSNRLGEAGREAEGLAAIEEAVKMYRALAAADPAAHEPDLAGELNNLSLRLGEAGRGVEGLAAIEEAVKMRRHLAAANPEAYEPDLARSLSNLSVDLAEADRGTESLAAIEEAVEVRRHLAAANPEAYEPDLARSLHHLGVRRREAGRGAESVTAIEEAVKMRRHLAAANPEAYEPDLASALNDLSNDLAKAGRGAESLVAIEEAVEVRRRLAAANPEAYEPDLAMSLHNLALSLGEAGRDEEAERVRQEAHR